MTLSNSDDYCVILVTAPNREQAVAIAQALVEAKLAACVNLLPIHSIYQWQGKIQHDEESQLLIKTKRSQFSAIETRLGDIHPYEVPEIIALPIQAGSAAYLRWIDESLSTTFSE